MITIKIKKTYKKHLISLLFIICHLSFSLALTSCDDYMTTPSKSALTTETSYNTPAQIDDALTGVYGALRPFAEYYFAMSEFRSDNMFIPQQTNVNQYADCAQFNTTELVEDNIVNQCWGDHYKLISAANVLLGRMGGVGLSEAVMKQYEAEARFLRALSYFDLVRFYGRVPVTLKEISPSEAFEIPQSEAIDVYNNVIVPDLLFAVSNLQETATDYKGETRGERVSRIAAKALLGKVYMQMAGYPLYQDTKGEAQELFADVLTDYGKYFAPTATEWDKMFTSDYDNKYFLFEIQYTCDKEQGNTATPLTFPSSNYGDIYAGARKMGGPHVYVERDLQDHFLMTIAIDGEDGNVEEEFVDKRINATLNAGEMYDEETGEMSAGAAAMDKNTFCPKFFENKIRRSQLGLSDIDGQIVDRTYWPQNWPVLRIEDVMLLYAECVGNTAEGYKYLNMIRQRAGLTELKELTAEAFQKAVTFERRCELIGEGHRWFDEVRQNTFVNDIQTMMYNYRDKRDNTHNSIYTIYATRVTQNSALYPIPYEQLHVREGLYQQNPGY